MGSEPAAARLGDKRQALPRQECRNLRRARCGLGEGQIMVPGEPIGLVFVGNHGHEPRRRGEHMHARSVVLGAQPGEERDFLVAPVDHQQRSLLVDQPPDGGEPVLGRRSGRNQHGPVREKVAGRLDDRVGGDDAHAVAHRREAERDANRRDAADAGDQDCRHATLASAKPSRATIRVISAVIMSSDSSAIPGWQATQTFRS